MKVGHYVKIVKIMPRLIMKKGNNNINGNREFLHFFINILLTWSYYSFNGSHK